jgi:hypothetical protein
MPTSTSPGRRVPARPLKSPLAMPDRHARPRGTDEQSSDDLIARNIALTDRQATLAEFEDHLRTTNNRDGRPYEGRTIEAYLVPGKNLDAWLTAKGIHGDFTVADTNRNHPTPYTDGLNRYAEVKGRPKTLGAEFVEDLLEVTGGGRARDFETARDHAMIRRRCLEGRDFTELLSA